MLARLRSNSRLKTGRKDRWPLQGRLACHCGGAWRCQPARRRQPADYYCRNRYADAPAVLRGADVCTVPRQRKRSLEIAVFNVIKEALSDREHLARALEASLNAFKASQAEYSEQLGPIDRALTETARQLSEIDRARIRGRLPVAELDAGEVELLARRRDLGARRAAYDPERLREFEEARELLPAVERLLAWAETYGREVPIRGGGPFISFTQLGAPPVDEEAAKLCALIPPEWVVESPETPVRDGWAQDLLTGLLDRLHVQVTMYPDRAEISGALPVTLALGEAPPALHASQVPRGLG